MSIDLEPTAEKALIAKAQQGDKAALNRLLVVHYPAVGRIARKTAWSSAVDHEDLTQAGILALARLVCTYKLDSGARLLSYAYGNIAWAMQDEIRRGKILHVTEGVSWRYYRAMKECGNDLDAARAWATSKDRPERDRMSDGTFDAAHAALTAGSLEDLDPSTRDGLTDPEHVAVQADCAQRVLSALNERERTIVRLAAEGLSDVDIAGRLGLSRPRISNLRKAIRLKAEAVCSNALD